MNDNKVDRVSEKTTLIKTLMRENFRVFHKSELQAALPDTFTPNYLSRLLGQLVKQGFLEKIQNGLYMVESFMEFSPVLEHEIAMKLVEPSMISHYSAFRYHGLTEQIPRVIFSTTSGKTIPQKGRKDKRAGFKFRGVHYHIFKTTPDKFFGHMEETNFEGSYKVTDLERTLLDGLANPELCGGFGEVMFGFEEAVENINLDKIIDYALKLDVATARRAGWALEQIGVKKPSIIQLAQRNNPGYRKLVACDPARGEYCAKWRLQLNL